MYKTDFIVRYRDIETELTKRLDNRLAEEVAAEISKAIQATFNFTNINIVTNVNGNPILKTSIHNGSNDIINQVIDETNIHEFLIQNGEVENIYLEEDDDEYLQIENFTKNMIDKKGLIEKNLIENGQNGKKEKGQNGQNGQNGKKEKEQNEPKAKEEKKVEPKEEKKKRGRKSKKEIEEQQLRLHQLELELKRMELEEEQELALEEANKKAALIKKQEKAKEAAIIAEETNKQAKLMTANFLAANDLENDSDDDDSSDYKYTRQDIVYICDKLYRDELISVFDADSLEDPKMDAGIKMVFEHLIKHDEFVIFLLELSPQVMDKSKAKTEQELYNFKRNTDYLIFITMFSQQLFYLTHQCICKMMIEKHVGSELIGELKGKLLKIFSYCNN